MSYAPASIKAAQEYLKPITGLPWASLGIVSDGWGDSYHRGDDRLGSDRRYSVGESSRDRNGLTDAASALDIGDFSVTYQGRRVTLRSLSLWLVEQCKASAPDTKDIRSVIYTPDGKVVRRWDRLGIRSSGDSSHLSHTHISWHRDSETRNKVDLFRRYFEGDDDVSWSEKIPAQQWAQDAGLYRTAGYNDGQDVPAGWHLSNTNGNVRKLVLAFHPELLAGQAAILAAVQGENADEIQARVRAELDRAAENERTERQAEYASLAEQLRQAMSEEMGAEAGEAAARVLAEIIARGSAA